MSADRKSKKPRTTVEAQIPGAVEGETVSRRRFMTATVHTGGAIAMAAFTLPAIGFAFGPIFDAREDRWESVGPLADFPADTYTPRTLTISPGIGDVGKTTVYVRKYNDKLDSVPLDQYSSYIAISTRCMHLGCPVRFVEASARFICPCHGGVYDFEGKRTGGPPVRPLDRFYTRVRNGKVEVGPRFSVNSELRRFSPRDPGQPLDGIGQYLYPARPSTKKIPGT
ncbi:MAG: menaquinol-cytochrome c reductase iron-sulfur subunit [Solirubrobacteraceae bacterium]|nr:menaquinol-cytochrome c reductase iron-sulfur subunit [Solirubrobacteraceae bacterium]